MTTESAMAHDPCPMEGRIDALEKNQRGTARAVNDSKREILDALASFRKELYGNGVRNADGTQAGVIPYLERRQTALEHRLDERDQQDLVDAEVEDEVAKELAARQIERKVEGYRDELVAKKQLTTWARVVAQAIDHWPVWVVVGAYLGRDGVLTLLSKALDLAVTLIGGGK